MPGFYDGPPRNVARSRHMQEYSKKLDGMNLSYTKRQKLWHRELRKRGW